MNHEFTDREDTYAEQVSITSGSGLDEAYAILLGGDGTESRERNGASPVTPGNQDG